MIKFSKEWKLCLHSYFFSRLGSYEELLRLVQRVSYSILIRFWAWIFTCKVFFKKKPRLVSRRGIKEKDWVSFSKMTSQRSENARQDDLSRSSRGISAWVIRANVPIGLRLLTALLKSSITIQTFFISVLIYSVSVHKRPLEIDFLFFAAKLRKKAWRSPRRCSEIGCRGCNSKTSFIISGYYICQTSFDFV